MAKLRDTDVLVVGGGPVGLLTALVLASRDISVAVVDESDRTAVHGYAVSLHPAALELLERVGITGDLIEHGHRIDSVSFWVDGRRAARLDLGRAGVDHAHAVALPQSVLEGHLRKRLKSLGVSVLWNHRLSRLTTDGGLEATVDRLDRVSVGYPVAGTSQVVLSSSTVNPRFVVGADGFNSMVRRSLGGEMKSLAPARLYAVFEFFADIEAPAEMRVVLGESGAGGLWPLPGGRARWGFDLGDPERFRPRVDERRLVRTVGQATFPHLATERLSELIRERAAWFQAEIGEVVWSVAVRFERRLSRTLGTDRVCLVGDAAHLTLPLGSHSMNLGIAEGSRIGEAIAAVVDGGADPAALLGAWRRDAASEVRALLRPREAFAVHSRAASWVDRYLPDVVSAVSATGEPLGRILEPLGIERLREPVEG